MPAYIKGAMHDDGGYATIYKGRRAIFQPVGSQAGNVRLEKTVPFSEVCIKEIPICATAEEDSLPVAQREPIYEEEINAILHEAFLHALVFKALEAAGHPTAVPHMHEVVAFTRTSHPAQPSDFSSIWITMEFITGCTLEKLLRRQLTPIQWNSHGVATPGSQNALRRNECLLLDVLIQLCFYLHLLQQSLCFNHRDLKVNNVFVRAHEPDWYRVMKLPDLGDWTCTNDIVLIDFGFSCIACGTGTLQPQATRIGAGGWFKSGDDCMKTGRDLAQFLYSLQAHYPLRDFITPAFFELLHIALRAETTTGVVDLWKGIDTSGKPLTSIALPKTVPFDDGIYLFLRDGCKDVPGCTPIALVSQLLKYAKVWA